jgi:hypothetical protein
MAKDIKIAIATTPRANTLKGIQEWKNYVCDHFSDDITAKKVGKLVVAMPTRTEPNIAKALDDILDDHRVSCFWAEMEPGLLGTGDTYRAACFFGFKGCQSGDNIFADYVLHMPIDVDFGNLHHGDVQENLNKMLDPIYKNKHQDLPHLVVGDYKPMIWEQGDAKTNPIKAEIEKHVLIQLHHFFPGNPAEKFKINRPRSEFFVISRQLFEKTTHNGRFSHQDPIPQLMVYAERNHYSIQKVDLGKFYETQPKFSAISVREQVFRTAHQISMEWLQWEHSSSMSKDTLKLASKRWQNKIDRGMKLAFKAFEQILPFCH